jgi:hypothetical protein
MLYAAEGSLLERRGITFVSGNETEIGKSAETP